MKPWFVLQSYFDYCVYYLKQKRHNEPELNFVNLKPESGRTYNSVFSRNKAIQLSLFLLWMDVEPSEKILILLD